MSELKVDKVSPRTGTYVALNTVGSKNIIINGDMSIAQRGTSTASITSSGYYTVDRFQTSLISSGTWTQSQETDVPTGQGFISSVKMDCTTANGSLSTGSFMLFHQKFEGQNLQYLKKGTASAESLTLSFWVKSSKTGTYICELFDQDNTRQISKSYTIDSASTWEKKTITFAGDTTGTLDNDNGNSFELNFWLVAGSNYSSGTLSTTWTSSTNANRAVGQVNLADNTANDWYITGVQLEAGTTASDFEFLPYDMNLLRCQRYYYKLKASDNYTNFLQAAWRATNDARAVVPFPVTMRAIGSLSTTGTLASLGNGTYSSLQLADNGSEYQGTIRVNGSGATTGYSTTIRANNDATAAISFDAEL